VATELNPPLPRQAYVEAAPEVERRTFLQSTARLLNRFIFFSLLALFVVVAIPYGTVEPWSEAFFECAIFGLTALWIIEGMITGSWHISERALFLPLVVLVGFALLQAMPFGSVPETAGIQQPFWVAISADPYNTVRFALKLLALILAGALLLSHLNSHGRLRALIMIILCVALGSAIFGLLRQTAQRDVTGFLLPYLPLQAGYGQFINSNHFAYLMELALGLPLSLILARSSRHHRSGSRDQWLLFGGLATPLLLALVLSNSRGGLLGLLSQLLFILLFANYGRRKTSEELAALTASGWIARLRDSRWFRIVVSGLLLVTLIIGITWVGGNPLVNKLEAVSGEISEVGEAEREGTRRIDIWRATWRMIADNPLFGVGFGGYWVAIPRYHEASGKLIPQEAHNDYLEVAASGGIIGVAIGGWFLLVFLRRIREQLRSAMSGEQRAVCIGALAGIFAVAIHSLVDFGLHITINALVCTALVIIAIGRPVSERAGKKLFFRVSSKV
jgi:O-antigen ligase